MFLLIDPSPQDKVNLFLHLNNNWVQGSFEASSPLIFSIEEFLGKYKVAVEELKGLAILVGQGRFTATRVAVTVANTLAYALNVPAIAVKEIDLKNFPSQIASAPAGQYASARYSGPANIGGKKG